MLIPTPSKLEEVAKWKFRHFFLLKLLPSKDTSYDSQRSARIRELEKEYYEYIEDLQQKTEDEIAEMHLQMKEDKAEEQRISNDDITTVRFRFPPASFASTR